MQAASIPHPGLPPRPPWKLWGSWAYGWHAAAQALGRGQVLSPVMRSGSLFLRVKDPQVSSDVGVPLVLYFQHSGRPRPGACKV